MMLSRDAGRCFEQAAALPPAYGTAYRMLFTRGKLKAGERVMVLAPAAAWGCLRALAQMIGAEAGVRQQRCEMRRLKQIGASHVANYVDKPFSRRSRRSTASLALPARAEWTSRSTSPAEIHCRPQKCVNVNGELRCGADGWVRPDARCPLLVDYEHSLTFQRLAQSRSQDLLDLVAGGRLAPVIDKAQPSRRPPRGTPLEDREVVGKVLPP
jgi:alcohol dehydrogenase